MHCIAHADIVDIVWRRKSFSRGFTFIINNFVKLPCSERKPVLCTYYDNIELTAAKEINYA